MPTVYGVGNAERAVCAATDDDTVTEWEPGDERGDGGNPLWNRRHFELQAGSTNLARIETLGGTSNRHPTSPKTIRTAENGWRVGAGVDSSEQGNGVL